MATNVNKIVGSFTGLRIAEEASYKVLSSAIWNGYEPNKYEDMGVDVELMARSPIIDDRQDRKGVPVDLKADGGFNLDFTQNNLQSLMQGVMFAALRPKGEEAVTAVDIDAANPDEYELASSAGFLVGDLIKGSGFTNSANNAMNLVTAIVPNVSVEVATGLLVTEAPPAGAKIVVVGHQFAAGDIDVAVAGDFATYTSAVFNFTTLGLIPGEWFFVGGDSASLKFANAVNNGFKRVKSISANALVVDRSITAQGTGTMVIEASTTETIQFFFGRVLKNESTPSLILTKSYSIERTLGAPDSTQPTQIQAEYLDGAIFDEMTMNIDMANKITVDCKFIAATGSDVSGVTGVRAGTRPVIASEDAFNTSSDFTFTKMAVGSIINEFSSPLFAHFTDLKLTIKNNSELLKAVGTLGGFDVVPGQFQVMADTTVYFLDTTGPAAIRNNSNVELYSGIIKNNAGFLFDIPMIALGGGRKNVEMNKAVKMPLAVKAATAKNYDTNFNHTLLWVFFDYLPDLAEPV